jgi:hypothetical protein
MKSAEGLAFLKMNPGYPIRNKINNDLTMISRGLFGHMDDAGVDAFWKEFGFEPKRLGEAVTPIGEKAVKGELNNAEKFLDEALRGGNRGTPEKLKDFFQNINLGKFDMAGYWGQRIEQKASRKATTLGTMQGTDLYLGQYKLEESLGKDLVRVLDDLDPTLTKKIRNAVRSSRGMEGRFDDALGGNLNVNVDNILDDVTRQIGTDVRENLGTEILEALKNKLPEAIKTGKFDGVATEMRSAIEKHVEDLFQKNLDNLVDETKSQVRSSAY